MLQGLQQSSRLCQDILELERDFKYNLFLLGIKDKEIERYAAMNKELENSVAAQTREISKLNTQLMELQLKHELFVVETTNSTQRYENMIQHMTNKIKELQTENKKQQMQRENERNIYETDIKKNYMKILEEKDSEHQQERDEIYEHLKKEQCENKKLREELKKIVDENMSIRNEAREKHSDNALKISILQSELDNSHKEKNKIINDLKKYTKEKDFLESKIKTLQKEKDALKIELSKEKEFKEKHEEQLNEILSQKDNLKCQISIYEKELLITVEHLKKCKKENDEFKKQIETTKNSICAVSEHNNFDVLKKQNYILQDVIKNMRKERQEINPKIECKLTDLENMVDSLKTNILLCENFDNDK